MRALLLSCHGLMRGALFSKRGSASRRPKQRTLPRRGPRGPEGAPLLPRKHTNLRGSMTGHTSRLTVTALALVAIGFVTPLTAPARATEPNPDKLVPWRDCVQIGKTTWGEACSDADSVKIYLTNSCRDPVEVKACILKATGRWDCGTATIGPGKSDNWWTCQASRHAPGGNLWFDARKPGSNKKFGDPR